MRPRVRAGMTFGRDALGALGSFGAGSCLLAVRAGCGSCRGGSRLVVGRLGVVGGVLWGGGRLGFVGGLHVVNVWLAWT